MKRIEVDHFQPAEATWPIIETALARYSAYRRRGFKEHPDVGSEAPG